MIYTPVIGSIRTFWNNNKRTTEDVPSWVKSVLHKIYNLDFNPGNHKEGTGRLHSLPLTSTCMLWHEIHFYFFLREDAPEVYRQDRALARRQGKQVIYLWNNWKFGEQLITLSKADSLEKVKIVMLEVKVFTKHASNKTMFSDIKM